MITKRKLLYIADEFLRDVSSLGGMPFNLVLALVVVFLDYSLGIKLFLNFILVISLGYLIRLFYFKNRPKKKEYQTLLEKIDASSFPSIHSFRSFGVATILGFDLANFWLTPLLLLIACFIAYSRVFLQDHDYFDVLFGSFFGIILGFLIAII